MATSARQVAAERLEDSRPPVIDSPGAVTRAVNRQQGEPRSFEAVELVRLAALLQHPLELLTSSVEGRESSAPNNPRSAPRRLQARWTVGWNLKSDPSVGGAHHERSSVDPAVNREAARSPRIPAGRHPAALHQRVRAGGQSCRAGVAPIRALLCLAGPDSSSNGRRPSQRLIGNRSCAKGSKWLAFRNAHSTNDERIVHVSSTGSRVRPRLASAIASVNFLDHEFGHRMHVAMTGCVE